MIGYLARMRAYLSEMFPLPRHLLGALLSYLAVATFARAVHAVDLPLVGWSGIVGLWSYFAITLVLRLMDELKDADIDAELFPHRPLPSGRVQHSDVERTLVGVAVLYLAANLWSVPTALAAGATLAYAWLMHRRFFAPERLRRSLPLTLATHNPIVPLILAYGLALFVAESGMVPGELLWALALPYIVLLWSPFLGWELSRKIRASADEDAYVTYSQLLGRSGAVATMLSVQGLGLLLVFGFWWRLELAWWYPLLPVAGYTAMAVAGMRFLLRPSGASARLKPYAEAYIVALLAAQVLAFGVQVHWFG